MFERKIVVFVAVRGEKEFFLLRCMNFLSIKFHLELLQCSLYLEKHYSNFKKKKIGKILNLENLLEGE